MTRKIVGFLVMWCLATVHGAPSIESQPTCTSGKLDLVLVVDVSGGHQHRFETNRDAALDIVHSLPISWEKVVVAVIQYSKLAIMKLEFGSSETRETVNHTITALDWTGGVSYGAEAMDLAMIQYRRARNEAGRVIILFSDGNSLNTWKEVEATGERLRYSGAKIYAVSLSGTTYEPELKAYIGESNGTIVRTQSELKALKKELLGRTVPTCRTSKHSLVSSSKSESKNGGDEDKSDEHSNEKTKTKNGEKKKSNNEDSEEKSSTPSHASARKSKTTKRGEKHRTTTEKSKSNGDITAAPFVAFPKMIGIDGTTAKATPRTTRTTRKTTRTTRTTSTTRRSITTTTSGSSEDGDEATTVASTHHKSHKSKSTGSTTTAASSSTTDFFDPVARSEAIEKMIDRAAH